MSCLAGASAAHYSTGAGVGALKQLLTLPACCSGVACQRTDWKRQGGHNKFNCAMLAAERQT